MQNLYVLTVAEVILDRLIPLQILVIYVLTPVEVVLDRLIPLQILVILDSSTLGMIDHGLVFRGSY